jgi:hypothetical protein
MIDYRGQVDREGEHRNREQAVGSPVASLGGEHDGKKEALDGAQEGGDLKPAEGDHVGEKIVSRQRVSIARVVDRRMTLQRGQGTVGGYALLEVKSEEEARALARQFMELHRVHWPEFEG